jgi:hypothetical protein
VRVTAGLGLVLSLHIAVSVTPAGTGGGTMASPWPGWPWPPPWIPSGIWVVVVIVLAAWRRSVPARVPVPWACRVLP